MRIAPSPDVYREAHTGGRDFVRVLYVHMQMKAFVTMRGLVFNEYIYHISCNIS